MAEDDSQFTESFDDNRDDGTEVVFQAGEPEVPEMVGRYRVERWLGSGGFGAVYQGFDPQLKRPVAIKVPHAHLIHNRAAVESYLEEARNIANLDHPNIVPVFDVGTSEDFPCFIVSRYVEGCDLGQRIKTQPLSIRESAELVSVVASALHYAHKQGLVHRDIKPNNLMVDNENRPFVVDFGLALREENIGKGPTYVGTAAFMSPEQARGEGHRVDGRSDIFSLGVVLYFLLVGRRPFRAETKTELLDQISSFEAKPLRQYDDQIPKELERICLKAMSKKANERYSTAGDFAEDLRLFLGEFSESTGPASRSQSHVDLGTTDSDKKALADSTKGNSNTQVSDQPSFDTTSQAVRIIPKGLRSFEQDDFEFFLELVPGARDRAGIPDVIRFWKSRIEQMDSDQTFSVGLIYGPSGCGKSSLVKAGLLPRLTDNVIPVYVEASPEDTEVRLLSRLRKQCPSLDASLGLKDSLAALRNGIGLPIGKKVVVIIDQFEQWLHANRAEGSNSLGDEELTRALRQCDGGQVQCILMVRDDFWMAVTRLLHELEVELLQGHNFACVDLFPLRHAEKVLTAFGRAFGALDEESAKVSSAEREFIKQAVTGLSEDGKVICVRLALFAEMMKGRPWTLQSLKQVGGTEGVGFNFLEETFNSNTNPKYRLHQKAARAVLKALLPETGSDIKGEMRSHNELLEISGYAQRPNDFAELMSILDREIRLVTPTDPEGDGESDPEESVSGSGKYYQLTHDYLVHSLRQWLTRKEKETRKGRARLRLQDLAATWSARPENRYLPTLSEYLRIKFLTSPQEWNGGQARMMKRAGVVHGWKAAGTLAIVLLIGFVGLYIRNQIVANQEQAQADLQNKQNQTRARSLVDRLVSADIKQIGPILADLEDPEINELAQPQLLEAFSNNDLRVSSRFNLALALVQHDPNFAGFLTEQIPDVSTTQYAMAHRALQKNDSTIIERLQLLANKSELSTEGRFQVIAALATMDFPPEQWQPFATLVARHLTNGVPAGDVFFWMEQLRPRSKMLIPELGQIVRDRDPKKSKQRERACLLLSQYLVDEPQQLVDHLLVSEALYEFQPLFESLEPHAEKIVPRLLEIIEAEMPRSTTPERDRRWKAKAIATVALIKLGRGQSVWPYLSHSHNSSLRSFIVFFLRSFRVNYDLLLDQTRVEPDESIRRALVLGAGHFQDADPPSDQSIEYLRSVYQHDTDPGVHGAAAFTLRQWKVELPALSNGLERIPPKRISELKQLEMSVDEIEQQLQQAIKGLPSKQDDWESKLVNSAPSGSNDSSQVDLNEGLIVHVPFDETSGELAANLPDSKTPGTITGAVKPLRVPGVLGNALKFDGESQSVVLGKSFAPELTDSFSIGCWIYFDDTTQVASLVSKMETRANLYRGFDFWFEAGRVGAHFKNAFPDNMIKVLTTSPISASNWHQVWVVYDGSGVRSRVKLVVDGKLASSDVLDSSLTRSIQTDVPLKIGSRRQLTNPGSPTEFFCFDGQIDDVRIYNRAVSEQEIQELYRQGLQSVARVPKADRTVEQTRLLANVQLQQDNEVQALQKQAINKKVELADRRWDGRARWFQNSQGQTLVVVPQPLTDGERPFEYDFAMGATEVTVQEFKRFNPTPGFLQEITPTADCPAHQLNWFDAAKYCNWLSEQDGIPESQWCYLPNDEGKWEPGAKIKPDYKKLNGYRMPTSEEWEYSARALSRRKYCYGEPVELLSNYGWYAVNSQAQTHPVGSLLPNDFGLFDMHGNVWEWIHDKPGDTKGGPVVFGNERRILGGGFNYRHFAQRSENSFYNLPNNRVIHFGFRVVRVLPDSLK